MTIPYDHQDSPFAADCIGGRLPARPSPEDLRTRLPSMVLSLAGHGAAAALVVYLSVSAVMPVPPEQTISVSIAPVEQPAAPEPPPVKMPDIPKTVAQVAPPQIEIAAPPVQMAIQAAPPPPPAPVQRTEKPVEEAPVSPPRFDAPSLNNPPTVYPNMSRRLREVGTVLFRVRVSSTGLPLEIQQTKSSGYARLDEAALAALRKWKFQPAMRGGEALEAWVVVPIEFSLTR
jgi:protein TonB